MVYRKSFLTRLTKEEIKKLDEFWMVANRIEEYVNQYGHTGRCVGWEDRRDKEFVRAFARIRSILKPLHRNTTYTHLIGIPNGRILFTPTALEALYETLQFPDRLLGELPLMHGPEYAALHSAAERELASLLPQEQPDIDDRSFARPVVRGVMEENGKLSFRCNHSNDRVSEALHLTNSETRLLMVLGSKQYREENGGWDEFVWEQLWGLHRGDQKPAEAYKREEKENGRDDGPPAKFRQLITSLNGRMREAFGNPPTQRWVIRVLKMRKQSAYWLNNYVDWKILPKISDRADETILPADEIEAIQNLTRRKRKPRGNYGND